MAVFRQVGLAIRLARGRAGLTLTVLAERAAVGKSQLSKYEKGKELPKFESLARIINALGTDALTFFCWANRLARDVADEDIGMELLQARCAALEVDDPFKKVLGDILDLYRLYIDV
jgi:transcriptional regulator with XRE-family HTH domain